MCKVIDLAAARAAKLGAASTAPVQVATEVPAPQVEHYTRDEAIAHIKAALKQRSGRQWSVIGGRGTSWGWIEIKSVKKYAANEYGELTEADQKYLSELLGLDKPVHFQGESIPAGSDYYIEYVQRAEGRPVTVFGHQYWD